MFFPFALIAIGLFNQDFMILSIPCTRPRMICPAKAIVDSDLGRIQQYLTRLLQQMSALIPIMVANKTFNAILLCQICLPLNRFFLGQIIIILIKRNEWLHMTGIDWFCSLYSTPFCISGFPPFVIFWDFVKLRKIQRPNPHISSPYCLLKSTSAMYFKSEFNLLFSFQTFFSPLQISLPASSASPYT